MKVIGLSLCVSLLAGSSAASNELSLDASDGLVLTLDGCVNTAIKNATSVLLQQNNVELQGAQLLQSYAQFLPNLNAQGTYGYSAGAVAATYGAPSLSRGDATSGGFTITSTFNLFNGVSDFATFRSSLLKKSASELTLKRAKQQIAVDVTQSFLQVVLDNKIVDIARKNLELSQARQKLLDAQTAVGIRSVADLYRQQAQTSSDELFLLNALNKTRTDQIELLTKLRVDISGRYHFVEPPLIQSLSSSQFSDEDALIKTALSERVDLKASNNLARAAEWDLTSSVGGYWPRLDLVGTAVSGGRYLWTQEVNGKDVVPHYQRNIVRQMGDQINYTVGLALTWNLFDRLLTNLNVEKAQVGVYDSKIIAQDTLELVKGDVRRTFGDYRLAIQQLTTSQTGLQAAQKAYEVVAGRYAVGAANFIDLITAQATLVQAQSTQVQVALDCQVKIKNVELAVGTLDVN